MQSDRLKNKYLLVAAILLLLSVYIAATRVYQVDEAENVYSSWLLASGKFGNYDLYAPIYLFGLQFLTRLSGSAEGMFLSARLVWVAVFWAILILIALCVSADWKGKRFWRALTIAGFSAPLWTYGLEVRHDGPALVLLLAIWLVLHPRRAHQRGGYFLVGSLFALVYFCAAKDIVYAAPLVLLALLIPHPHGSPSASRRWIQATSGLLSSIALFILLHLSKGTLGQVLKEYQSFLAGVVHTDRFAPWALLRAVTQQSPFILVLAILPILTLRKDRVRDHLKNAWSNGVAELVFIGSIFFGLLINPTPFPYNALPFTAVALAVGLPPFLQWLEQQSPRTPGYAIGHGLLVCTLGVPWTIQIGHLLEMDNDRQVELMNLAERFTSPEDRVFDAAGLVPGRGSIQPTWYITFGNAPLFLEDPDRQYESLFRAHPPAVLIPTYRFSYLDAGTQAFLKTHYTPLAGDFWVLGGIYAGAENSWDCILSGRYWVVVDPQGGSSPMVDGQPVQAGVRTFSQGAHAVSTSPGSHVAIFWLGPNLAAPPHIREGAPGVFPIPIQM